jgi:hypothetical protein
MKKQTAVEWLFEKLPTIDKYDPYYADIFQQAKEKEREQIIEYAKFCIHCDRNKLPLLDFEGFLNL